MELIGRGAELDLVDEAIASARARRGGAVFVTGDAGLGKTAVLDAARARAEAAGLTVLAGAAWEAGGAPPYWPWLQILRAASDAFGAAVRDVPGAARIAALVPAWGDARAATSSHPEADRFALLDAASRGLVALSAQAPLAILLDDLHAADLPSLELLALLVRELPRAAIVVIGAWREGELGARPEVAQRLARAARHAQVSALRRLTAGEVAGWAHRRGGDGAALYVFSEGNPLFVEEALRARHLGAPPAGVDAVIRDHLALVSARTRDVLGAAAVLGRDVGRAELTAIAGDVDAAMAEATAAGINEVRAGGWAFTHVLLRDHLYAALPGDRRAALHRAAGVAGDPADPSGGRAAHHLLRGAAGDPDHARAAIAAARAAADRAMRVFAFEDAAALLVAAATAATDREAAELRLAAAAARRNGGDVTGARADALVAIGTARALADVELLARGVLEHTAELVSGRRDLGMIALLEEAAAALPERDDPIRARVLARLGTSVSPPIDAHDRRPFELAEAAVAMARRIGDDETLLYTLRFRGHTFGYMESYTAQLAVCESTIEIAQRLGRPLDVIDQMSWLIGVRLCAGDLPGSERALDDVLGLVAPVHHPQFRWRGPVLRASRAIRRGELAEAARHAAIVRQIAADHGLDRARICALFVVLSIVQADPSAGLSAELIAEARTMFAPMGAAAGGPLAFLLAAIGEHDAAREALAITPSTPALIVSQLAGEAALLLHDRDHAARLLPMLITGASHYPVAIGPSGAGMLCPSEITVGELLFLVGRTDEAIAALTRGLALARRIEAPRYAARAEAALARAAAPVAATIEAAPVVRGDGARVRVTWRGASHELAASKGLGYLERLLDAAGQELHVSALVGADDGGDAGEVLDAAARDAYRRRAIALRAELDDAEACHDLGRAERARRELDALTEQLSAAVGLGGRARKAASHVERARINVQRRLKDTIRRIGELDAALGRYLEATVRTGTFCAFVPLA